MSDACETPMRDHVARFWRLLRNGHVRILVNTLEGAGFEGENLWSSSSFPDDVAKAIAAENDLLRDALDAGIALINAHRNEESIPEMEASFDAALGPLRERYEQNVEEKKP